MDLKEAAYRAHAMSAGYARRVDEALALIDQGLALCRAPYVACSFGKDSAVLLDLVMRRAPDIEARFIRWPETEHLGNYSEVIEAWRARGARIHILDLWRASLDEKVGDRWKMLRDTADGVFIGLRAEESLARRTTLLVHGTLFHSKEGHYRISPLAWWRTRDIAAYVVTHDLPTLTPYKRHGFSERTSSRIPRASVRGDLLRQIRSEDPQAWAGLVALYPEVEVWANL
jgi:3'-phosphoadenosine 5'-phosphosulfate sulfotransferase (PAPS reductase)/FAD synthetase